MASYVECFPKISRMPGMRKHGKEWKGPCPCCGGTDRFIMFQGRDDRLGLWCRQCGGGRHLYDKLESLSYIPVRQAHNHHTRSVDHRIDSKDVTYAHAVVSAIQKAIDTCLEYEITFEESWMQHGVEPMTLDEAFVALRRSLDLILRAKKYGEKNKPQSDHCDEAFKRAALREAQLRKYQDEY